MLNNQRVLILLATYNGSRYLPQQIRSIQAQQFTSWSLVIRDDGSTDDTINIINDFAHRDKRITLLKDSYGPTGSAVGNFSLLMQYALNEESEYIMFSDQDDIWDSDKIDMQIHYMRRLSKTSPNKPFLIHTDLQVVSEDSKLINSSFMKYQRIHHEYKDALKVLLTQNFVTGCTVLINRPLLEMALPIPDTIIMHDWWLALCAASVGGLEYIDKSTIKYRQHSFNQIGASGYWATLNPFRINWLERWSKGRKEVLATIGQSCSLREILENRKSNYVRPDSVKICNTYTCLLAKSRLSRLSIFNSSEIHRQDKLRQILLIFRIFTM